MSKKALITALAVICALTLSASAFAAKGGKGGSGGGGGGSVDPTLAISTQQVGSVTFSVMVPATASGSAMVVTVNCYDAWSQVNYTAANAVVWSTATVGYAGPFSPTSGESCFAFVHTPTSSTPLPGGTFSFVAL